MTKQIPYSRPNFPVPTQERGAALLIALLLLLGSTMIVLYTAQAIITEHRLIANDLRAKQGFQAAEAGMEFAVAYMSDDGIDQNDDDTSDDLYYNGIDANADSDFLDTGDSTITSPLNGATYTVKYCAPGSPLPTCNTPTSSGHALVYSIGNSDDGLATQYAIQEVKHGPAIANGPKSPLTTAGACNITGNGKIINPEFNTTIWAGDAVEIQSNTGKTHIPNPADTTTTIETSNKNRKGPDIIDRDANLGSATLTEFFENTFGVSPTEYENSYATEVIDATNSTEMGTLDGMEREIIWINGDPSFTGGTIGTADNPVVLIIDGDMGSTTGNLEINGLVFILDDWDKGAGTVEINGAVMVFGDTDDIKGNLTVTYSGAILGQLSTVGAVAPVPGTWRDFL